MNSQYYTKMVTSQLKVVEKVLLTPVVVGNGEIVGPGKVGWDIGPVEVDGEVGSDLGVGSGGVVEPGEDLGTGGAVRPDGVVVDPGGI